MAGPEDELQREVTRTALAAIGVRGFVLAGSGAIREHGFVDRPTRDVDLSTDVLDTTEFASAVSELQDRLRAKGFVVEELRRAPQFAQLMVTDPDGEQVEVELEVDVGVDWRAHDPATGSLGPVLSERDAVASKVVALYENGGARLPRRGRNP